MAQEIQKNDSLSEPLHSLKLLNILLLALFMFGFVMTIILSYNRTELLGYLVIFGLNVVSAVAIVIFLFGVQQRKFPLILLYQVINGCALVVGFITIGYFFGFNGPIWGESLQNLSSTTFAFIYEFSFIGANAFVCLLVSVKSRELSTTRLPNGASPKQDYNLVKDAMEPCLNQLEQEVDLFVSSIGQMQLPASSNKSTQVAL